MSEQELLLELADDELVLGWRDSEWTGIAPVLEEDVAFSSIAQNEIGHARARLRAAVATTPTRSRSTASRTSTARAPLVELRFVPDWARTIARRVLYEAADEIRHRRLKALRRRRVAGLAAKIDREEAYHRMHAQMWTDRLRDEPRFREAVEELSRTRSASSTPERPARSRRARCPGTEA